jgi:hypothetical protein
MEVEAESPEEAAKEARDTDLSEFRMFEVAEGSHPTSSLLPGGHMVFLNDWAVEGPSALLREVLDA